MILFSATENTENTEVDKIVSYLFYVFKCLVGVFFLFVFESKSCSTCLGVGTIEKRETCRVCSGNRKIRETVTKFVIDVMEKENIHMLCKALNMANLNGLLVEGVIEKCDLCGGDGIVTINSLKATGVKLGIIVNFGTYPKVEICRIAL